jgi:hypothetical protein
MIRESREIYLKLREAAIESQRREVLAMQAELCEPHVFSDEFNRKMEKLLRFSRKPYFRFVNTAGKRVAVFVLAIITALTLTTFSVEAFRKPFINFVISVYEKFTGVEYQSEGEEIADFPSEIEEIFMPITIPAGYALTENNNYGLMVESIYSNGINELIFEQYTISSMYTTINTEGSEIEKLTIDDKEILIYSNQNVNVIIWVYESYGFKASGEIDKNELLKLVNLDKI